jgi:hypothetical protein
MSTARLHIMVRSSTRGEAGHALGYGVQLGYWPCLCAPFVQIRIHRWIFQVWFGLPSYRYKGGGKPGEFRAFIVPPYPSKREAAE